MILYGASGHCKVIIDILEARGERIDFIVDDNPSITELCGYPVRRNTGEYDEVIVSIGSADIRRRIVSTIRAGKYLTAVHPSAVVSPRAGIAEGTVVMQGSIIQSGTRIGRHCIINTAASVDHDCSIGDFVHVAPHCTLCGDVTVGEGTWIGAGTTVIQGIHIGKNCYIGAGSVVVKDIPDGSLAFGNPCRIREKK